MPLRVQVRCNGSEEAKDKEESEWYDGYFQHGATSAEQETAFRSAVRPLKCRVHATCGLSPAAVCQALCQWTRQQLRRRGSSYVRVVVAVLINDDPPSVICREDMILHDLGIPVHDMLSSAQTVSTRDVVLPGLGAGQTTVLLAS
jgi:hypothetical protein